MKTKKLKSKFPFCTEYQMSDKSSIRISSIVLEELWNKSKDAEQLPRIVIGLRRNDKEVFMISGELTVEKQRKI